MCGLLAIQPSAKRASPRRTQIKRGHAQKLRENKKNKTGLEMLTRCLICPSK